MSRTPGAELETSSGSPALYSTYQKVTIIPLCKSFAGCLLLIQQMSLDKPAWNAGFK